MDVFNLAMLAALSVKPKFTFDQLNNDPLLTIELMHQVHKFIEPIQLGAK